MAVKECQSILIRVKGQPVTPVFTRVRPAAGQVAVGVSLAICEYFQLSFM